ncbi:MAG: hypothetical protein COT84_06545 [Chlamydiae bacterium CG10_big_fil_rev_8_21_14_0_10_35_9]|nr:MAG: hypothetical protein COT84_06545 [Chlamydiae bacterium CG10_big_fil_rev_8_21_14_0_10_35_9]
MKLFSKKNNSIIFSLILGEKFQHIGLYLKVFFSNLIAAFLEGGSFGFLFLSLSIMNQNSTEFLKENSLIKFFHLSDWIQSFSIHELFIIFILAAVGFQILRSIGTWVAQYVTAVLITKIQSEMQLNISRKIFSFSFSKVHQYRAGDLVEYIKSPTACIQALLEHFNILLVSVLMIFGSSVIMTVLSFKLTILTFLLFIFFGGIQRGFFKKIAKTSQEFTQHSVNFSNEIVQSINGIRVLHIFNKQKSFMKKITHLLKSSAKAQRRLAHWNGILVSYNETISVLIIGIILVFGAFLVGGQKESVLPLLLTFLGLSHRTATKVQLIFRSIGSIAGNYGTISRFSEILSEQDPYQEVEKAEKIPCFTKSIDYQNIEIVYPTQKKPAITDFSYTLTKGKTIALVGASGAGKSTIIDLLLGLYRPTKGQIAIDGKDLSSFDIKSWRDQLGVVSQDVFIFHDTVEENICFGSENVTQSQIEKAAKEAGAHDFISKLSKGYKTILGEKGYRLSGGEKQRIALARALIRDPKILILDEATSNLDSHSEKLIQETIERNQHQRTIIIVAHRLSTITHSDEILVIDKGQLVEKGTHEALIEKKGFYAYLWNLQSSKKVPLSKALKSPTLTKL